MVAPTAPAADEKHQIGIAAEGLTNACEETMGPRRQADATPRGAHFLLQPRTRPRRRSAVAAAAAWRSQARARRRSALPPDFSRKLLLECANDEIHDGHVGLDTVQLELTMELLGIRVASWTQTSPSLAMMSFLRARLRLITVSTEPKISLEAVQYLERNRNSLDECHPYAGVTGQLAGSRLAAKLVSPCQ